MESYLKDREEFDQLLIFQGRFGGLYALIVPHIFATKMRGVISEGGDSALDYEVVIEAEKLFTDDDNKYPGVQAKTIKEVLEKLEVKFKTIDPETIFGLAETGLNELADKYGA